ncbi:Protein phosphatase 2C [Trichinella pseudospiralis]
MAQMIVLFQIVQACSPTWCAKRKDRSRRKKPDFCATGPNLEKWKKKAVHHHHRSNIHIQIRPACTIYSIYYHTTTYARVCAFSRRCTQAQFILACSGGKPTAAHVSSRPFIILDHLDERRRSSTSC